MTYNDLSNPTFIVSNSVTHISRTVYDFVAVFIAKQRITGSSHYLETFPQKL